MHVLLPDTALAKSHGIAFWHNPLHDTVYTLSSAFSFGAGLAVFWLLTFFFVVRISHRLTAINMLANALFPVLLTVGSLAGTRDPGSSIFRMDVLLLHRVEHPGSRTGAPLILQSLPPAGHPTPRSFMGFSEPSCLCFRSKASSCAAF